MVFICLGSWIESVRIIDYMGYKGGIYFLYGGHPELPRYV